MRRLLTLNDAGMSPGSVRMLIEGHYLATPSATLAGAFLWDATSAGFKFWSREHDNLMLCKPLSPEAIEILGEILTEWELTK